MKCVQNMNDDINNYLPSILNPRKIRKNDENTTLTQNSIVSHYSSVSLSLRKRKNGTSLKKKNACSTGPYKGLINKENCKNINNINNNAPKNTQTRQYVDVVDHSSLDFSWIEDLNTIKNVESTPSFGNIESPYVNELIQSEKCKDSLISVSSATELEEVLDTKSDKTVTYNLLQDHDDFVRPIISLSFGVNNCESIDVTTKKSNLKRLYVSHKNNDTNVECVIIEGSVLSTDSLVDENMNDLFSPSPPKKAAVTVNLEIKNIKSTNDTEENSKVLILNTNAIDKVSHAIIQPPNYKLVKRKFFDSNKFKNCKRKSLCDVKNSFGDNLKQKTIDVYVSKSANVDLKATNKRTCVESSNDDSIKDCQTQNVSRNALQDMSRNSGVADFKCDRIVRTFKGNWKDESSPRSTKVSSTRNSPKGRKEVKTSSSDAPRVPSIRVRNDSGSSHSPKKNVDSVQFNLPTKSRSIKTSVSPKNIPHYKIVAGTHFAVDAFSYGDIPNVKHYFLTHFHSDHYSGLKKNFNKLLFCSRITADLCISRLGVSPKCIHIMSFDETIRVEDVEVTAVDANHCPGAIMLIFTLPNGKTMLHTGDFRASPLMESYPVFWNKDVHTIYLDTTYCNSRYDFPTQDQSLEMALFLLRQKKMALESAGKKFSSVLIVCGTYTIGKEKFFLGMAKRVGCSVWACPEKDRVLQAVEGRSFSHAPPQSCQLHVVPMRDLTIEKLRSYLDSLQGAFSEVVAFKPSGWEIGKNSSVEKDMVTIHGIPYSEHSSFSELIRFVKFLKPKQVVPTVDISGGIKAVQKYFPCPLVYKEDIQCQSKLTDFFSIQGRQQVPAVT